MPRIGRFDEKKVRKWVTIITIATAAVFLIGPIVTLSFTQNFAAKLSLTILFTTGFAVSVYLVTGAERPELFTATAT